MISELVDGSAWMKPPVDGPADAAIGAAAALFAVPAVPAGLVPSGCWSGVLPPPTAPPPLLAAKAARNTVASLAASAFFR